MYRISVLNRMWDFFSRLKYRGVVEGREKDEASERIEAGKLSRAVDTKARRRFARWRLGRAERAGGKTAKNNSV